MSRSWLLVCLSLSASLLSAPLAGADRPNILWLSCEDISPQLGCYGDAHAITPQLDQLASEAVRYSHCFTTAGVCAPNRSGIITGMYQTTIGTHHMRCRAQLPDFIKPFSTELRRAGYYCTNNSKTDYQFNHPKESWDASNGRAHWRNRPSQDQPFFAVFNFTGCHESGIAATAKYQQVTAILEDQQRQDAAALSTLPPYYPDTDVSREDWKRNYELITAMDHWAGGLIQQLKDDGLYDRTIIFFWSDHGVGLPRAKRWLYDSGTHVPLIVRVPEALRTERQGQAGTVSDQLISSIDLGPTVLRLADVEIPDHIQGQPFLGANLPAPRDYVYGARDRMDERYDIIRMVRDRRFKYIRNYEPLKTFYQYMNTPETGATMKELRQLHEQGKLGEAAEYYFSPTKPVEELYDTASDPHELKNLADSPDHQARLKKMRSAHLNWVVQTRDLGLIAEPILVEREQLLGSRYAILRSGDDETLATRLARAAAAASSGISELNVLLAALDDRDPAIRYWGATGLGNIGLPVRQTSARLKKRLQDPSVAVRIAAARALCRMDQSPQALATLTSALADGAQWERLQAAIVLDEIDELALPVIKQMRAALKPRPDLYANGKYVIRVLNRALNQLEGTRNTVP